jgi:hypothetical protein
VRGSRAVFEEGVSIPRRIRLAIMTGYVEEREGMQRRTLYTHVGTYLEEELEASGFRRRACLDAPGTVNRIGQCNEI